MPKEPRILVIGAGLIGLSTAHALHEKGAEVTVLDARSGPMHGTSYSNSGMIHISQSRPWVGGGDLPHNEAPVQSVLSLARNSQKILERNFHNLGLLETLSRPAGNYQLFEDDHAARAAQSEYEDIGIRTELMSDAVKTLGHLALHFPDDRSGNAYDYGTALAKDLEAQKTVFIYKASDLRLRAGDKGVTAQLRGHIFHCDHIVVCAGPQSSRVLSQLGLSLPLNNVRGFAVNFERPDVPLPEAPLMDGVSRSALTVFENSLRLSGTLGEMSAHPLLKRWFHLAPHVMAALSPAKEVWSGLRPVSPLGRPYISRTPFPNLWVNTGHAHMGWTLCAGAGALMAEMILEGKKDLRFSYSG
jgi:D-amino-acid dehydrogenase